MSSHDSAAASTPPPDPACTSRGRHGTFTASKEDGCRCPGEPLERFHAYRLRQNARKADRAHERTWADDGHVNAPDFPSPDVPEPTHVAGRVQRALHARRDLACDGEELALFYPLTRAEALEAKQVCRRCPGQWECLTWALQTGDDHAVLGGTLPDERRALRARGWAA